MEKKTMLQGNNTTYILREIHEEQIHNMHLEECENLHAS